MTCRPRSFPFSAMVGCEEAKDAIRCLLVSPHLRSLLLCGPTGTGKTVLVRSLESLDVGMATVSLPLKATEDQLFGGVDLEAALRTGSRQCNRSLMQRADGMILVAENFNLLPSSIAHQVLDCVAEGRSVVEREGISEVHHTRPRIIALMDPAEGEMSRHLLDRFDMCVIVHNLEDDEQRILMAQRCDQFDRHPVSFLKTFQASDEEESRLIVSAQGRCRNTVVPTGYTGQVSRLALAAGAEGHRGDISTLYAACALAALDGREEANHADIKTAASLCLSHRRNEVPPTPPPPPPRNPPEKTKDGKDDGQDDGQNPADPPLQEPSESEDQPQEPPEGQGEDEVFAVGEVFKVRDYIPPRIMKGASGHGGRRDKAIREISGRCIGHRIPKGRVSDVALCASIRAASPMQVFRDHSRLAVVLEKDDLREKVREKRQGASILFLVDGSGSMGAQRRMTAVKGAVLSMLKDAYQKRDEVGLVVFRGQTAEEVLPMTRSVARAFRMMEGLPIGGRTPLVQGIIRGAEILDRASSTDREPVMVILTDGRGNVNTSPGRSPKEELMEVAGKVSQTGIRFIVVDTEAGQLRMGHANGLCRALDGTYLRLEELDAGILASSVRQAMGRA